MINPSIVAGGLYTDFYQLTMAQGYFLAGKHHAPAMYDYYFRKLPFEGGFVIFAGWAEFVQSLAEFRFNATHLDFLRAQGFREEFLAYLQNFRFSGRIVGVLEGEVVFPQVPLVSVYGNLLECQVIETALLNILNFQSLIATKAARIRLAAGADKKLLEFGLRRAQGLGAMAATRAAAVGGFDGTSNVAAAYHYELASSGTMAHAWIQSFEDELTAFRTYAQYYPDNCVLLIDTYNTLESGIPNAIQVGKELEANGHRLKAVRLDSGDLAYLSKAARERLDDAGLSYVKIAATNDLDERLIKSLIEQNSPIDIFGVGTRLVTAQDCPALGGVYKLVEIEGKPRIKLSDNIVKISLPGNKSVYRALNPDASFNCDVVMLAHESECTHIYHPQTPDLNKSIRQKTIEPLRQVLYHKGAVCVEPFTVEQASAYCKERLALLPAEHKRFDFPHVYQVGVSETLLQLRANLIRSHKHPMM